jgi:hypothetical protein
VRISALDTQNVVLRDRIQKLMLLLHKESGLNTNFGGGSFVNKNKNI